MNHPRKGLINIQNIDDNDSFKWIIVRYLNSINHNPRRTTKDDKQFAKKFDFKNIKFPVKIRDIHKIKKKKSINISVFGYENKEKHPIFILKNVVKKKHVHLLLIGEEGRRYYVLIQDFNDFMYYTLLYFMIILYSVEENIFIVIVYKLLAQKKY